MSYGGPNTQSLFIKPPLKGSFLLDHDGMCASLVKQYLGCIKKVSKLNIEGVTDQIVCRGLIKAYFECRMSNGLMEREEWDALGLQDEADNPQK